jgi:hypothetical protein
MKTYLEYKFLSVQQKMSVVGIFVCSFSPRIIYYAYPNFRTTCAMSVMFTVQHEFELLTIPMLILVLS